MSKIKDFTRGKSWVPETKVLVAGTVGPALAAGVALLLPRLPTPVATVLSSVVTAVIAYLTPPHVR